jgi:hypothetical protein
MLAAGCSGASCPLRLRPSWLRLSLTERPRLSSTYEAVGEWNLRAVQAGR